jgi:hypothetical protein
MNLAKMSNILNQWKIRNSNMKLLFNLIILLVQRSDYLLQIQQNFKTYEHLLARFTFYVIEGFKTEATLTLNATSRTSNNSIGASGKKNAKVCSPVASSL